MKALIVATNATALNIWDDIHSGTHHRVDYLELSNRLSADYMDYNTISPNKLFTWLEEKLRMDIRLAFQVAAAIRHKKYHTIFSLSERVAIPLTLLVGGRVRHIVQIAHPLSRAKLRLFQATRAPWQWETIIVPTRAEARGLSKTFPSLKPERINTIHYAVDTQFYQPIPSEEISPEPMHFESLGLSYRDYPTLIRALHKLPNVLCYIRAGSTWVNIRAGYEQEEIPANIQLKPYVHPSVLRQAYASARFLVVPIRHTTQWSAGCTTVSQAMAMGRPVIASRNPGMGDYLPDGEAGLLVETGNPDALADAIDELWKNPEKIAAMGKRARQWVEENLSFDRWLERISRVV